MTARTTHVAPAPVPAVEAVELVDGWTAVGVEPGSADHRLDGLDGALLTLEARSTAGEALRRAGLWRPGSGRDLDAEDWWFRCRFDAPAAADGEELALRLGGVATVADVWLNGEHVLASDDMHLEHELACDALRPGENELVIGVRALAPLLAQRRPRPRWRTRLVVSQGLRWYRTALTGRLPAFSPEPAPVGPWRPVVLERRSGAVLEDARVRTRVDGADGVVHVTAELRPLDGFEPVAARVAASGCATALRLERAGGRIVATGALRIPDVELWWPSTHGSPSLHAVELELAGCDRTVVFDLGRAGFRTLSAATEPGLALRVNGVDVFCRGGSLLPDAFTLDLPGRRLRDLLVRARDGGLNMIRLSGIGTYGSDALYDLCDELGLLVWQDFPFANLDYPIEDEGFRAAVELEARQFLARAGRRPSLAVLCGNSEIEQQVGMLGLDPELGRGPLFGELLPALATELEVDAHYVPSSPSGGALPFRPGAGVAHYFGVGAYLLPLEDARRAEVRFASECLAFANVPDDRMLARLAPSAPVHAVHHPAWKAGVPRDVGAGWDFDDVRDHYLAELYRLDPAALRRADPERYLALSRVVTGEVMAATMGEWRRARSTCRGALVWTLNDVLRGAGWGILDVSGAPKAAYWYLRRALAPVAVWMTDEGTNGLAVHVANDTSREVGGTLSVALVRADGLVVDEGAAMLVLAPHSTVERDAEGVLGRFADAGHVFRFGPAGHEVVVATLSAGGGVLGRAFHFPGGRPAGVQPVGDLGLDASVVVEDGRPLELAVTARRVAYAIGIDVPGFEPEDDYVTVVPGHGARIRLRAASGGAEWAGGSLAPLNADGTVPIRMERA